MKAFSFLVNQKKLCANPNSLKKMFVNSSQKKYPVTWNNSKNLAKVIKILLAKENNYVIVDKKIAALLKLKLHPRIFIIEAKESNKSLATIKKILAFFDTHNLTKSEKVIVVGGGITQDIAGFACAIYKRGIPRIFLPTTLLSMCDSCLGGKVTLNNLDSKSQLGLFNQPDGIEIFPEFLSTLDERMISSGLAEILKSCIVGGKAALTLYEKNVQNGKVISPKALRELVFLSLNIKKAVIEKDEFEANERRSLNYGHSFGHAIEGLSRYKIPHGHAVALGMMLANQLSYQSGLLGKKDLEKLNRLCKDIVDKKSLELFQKMDLTQLTAFFKKDKKAKGKTLYFVLIKTIGDLRFVPKNLGKSLNTEVKKIIRDLFLCYK